MNGSYTPWTLPVGGESPRSLAEALLVSTTLWFIGIKSLAMWFLLQLLQSLLVSTVSAWKMLEHCGVYYWNIALLCRNEPTCHSKPGSLSLIHFISAAGGGVEQRKCYLKSLPADWHHWAIEMWSLGSPRRCTWTLLATNSSGIKNKLRSLKCSLLGNLKFLSLERQVVLNWCKGYWQMDPSSFSLSPRRPVSPSGGCQSQT